MRDVQLEWLAAEVMVGLPSDEARAAVRDLCAEVAACSERWPAPGGEEAADVFGSRCWVSIAAYADGLEVRDVGWCVSTDSGPSG
ncbi:hypothetical protein [Streptomyces sp. BE133]|uniref:hypothetical protein n=1 Tax=Streptomyces sp. BE133 TaxID=3002523 RepID=UPI002E7A4085|nr:hypothetical protein [Streptomyces sp. BE133]MEE1804858.1 hypothetical protein [Streptomyces sp. BE133]